MQNVEVYVGIGSNLQDPIQQVLSAFQELESIPNTSLVKTSSLYKSKPMGPAGQPDYINAVVKISTTLDAEALLQELQKLEQAHQRVRKSERWGPRTLDLDIILFGDAMINSDTLQIPHSGMAEREFVLIPLQEIDSDLIIPGKGRLQDLVQQLPEYELIKIDAANEPRDSGCRV